MAKGLFRELISQTSDADKELLIAFLGKVNGILDTNKVASRGEVDELRALKKTTEDKREKRAEMDGFYSGIFKSYLDSVMEDFHKYQAKLSLSTSRVDTTPASTPAALPPIQKPQRVRALSDSVFGPKPAGKTPKIDPALLAIRDPERTPEIKSGVPGEGRLPPLHRRRRRSLPQDDSDTEARLNSLLDLTDRRFMELLLEVRHPDAEETAPNPVEQQVEQQQRRPQHAPEVPRAEHITSASKRISAALAFAESIRTSTKESETASTPGTPHLAHRLIHHLVHQVGVLMANQGLTIF